MQPGEIYRHEAFYIDDHGRPEAKYVLLLAVPPREDVVARLLTSEPHGRPEQPACYHGVPYGGYFLGMPGEPLTRKTWVDLRYLDDFDAMEFRKREAKGILALARTIPTETLRSILECVAAADDTTRYQERRLRDALARLRT